MSLIIKHTNLSEGIHYYDFEESVSSLQLENPFYGTITVDVELDKAHNQIVLNIEVVAKVNFECDRCGGNFNALLENNFDIVYFFNKENVTEDDEDIYYLPPEQDKINFGKDVVEHLLLAIPMKKLCDDNCKGLCLSCGVNLNKEECKCESEEINPIWNELLKLKDKLN